MALQTIPTWIREDNLHAFLDKLSGFIGYNFGELDWDAVRFGVQDSDEQARQWYTYDLYGDPFMSLAFARSSDAERLAVRVETEQIVIEKVKALALVLQTSLADTGSREIERLVETAFSDRVYPGDNNLMACDAAHLSRCVECQETLAYFQGKHWLELMQSGDALPYGYGGLGFLTPEAQRFFFPAYVAVALRNRDKELLERALQATTGQSLSPLQQQVVELASLLTGTKV